MTEFTLTIIGSGSALPMHGRHPSAQLLQYGDMSCLIDCGEGTQERMRAMGVKFFKVNFVFISHLHGDHIFGLPGLLSSWSHLGRKDALTVFGPPGIKGLLEAIITYTELKITYPLHVEEKSPRGLTHLMRVENLEILTFPLNHRIACNGYLMREIKPVVRFRKEAVHGLHLTVEQIQALQQGKDIEYKGSVIANERLTYGPAEAISYAYCSDTRYDPSLIAFIRGVTVLYHETTFKNDMSDMAQQTGHTTAGEAGQLAAAAGVSCLITGHYSSRYKDVKELVGEARTRFQPVLEAEEGKKYNLRSLSLEQ